MLKRILALPLFVILMGLAALAMFVPMAFAMSQSNWDSARAYGYSGVILLALTAMIALATAHHRIARPARSHLLSLLAAFALLPLLLAVPLYESIGDTRFLNAYFEMVSSLTTTGATVFDMPGRISPVDHLWRALVGWLGGFLMWVAAVAILAPLNLGGFEVLTPAGRRRADGAGLNQITRIADPARRVQRYALQLAPIYGGLTLVLWILLLMLGDRSLTALCHAMSTLSTSGISPVGGTVGAGSGFAGELAVFVFLAFAVSRRTFTNDGSQPGGLQLVRDPEIRIGVFLVLAVPVLLFLRHWVGAYEVENEQSLPDVVAAMWGAVFTVMSFLTTTGFESIGWTQSRAWSGLETPGLILMGLALIGGGVATTAGGVKLLRVYALYKHGQRELEKLVHPSSIGGAGATGRQFRREGAYVAWIFFMLFAMSIAAVMLALSLTGLAFEPALVLTIAALSTTGPLAHIAGEVAISYATLGDGAKLILAASMVLGRLETLAIIALLNPAFWRS